MRKFMIGVISFVSILSSTLAFVSVAHAGIKFLPPSLKSSAATLESAHSAGIGVFFRSLEEEDCDKTVILDQKFFRSSNRPGMIPLFRIESRVEASCIRREIWHCRSVFEGNGQNTKFTYKYTDCETDAPLVED